MRAIQWLLSAAVGIHLVGCAGMSDKPSQEVIQALAPTGKLRVGLYVGGPTSIMPGSTTMDSRGVGFDLGKAIAQRLDVPFEPVIYKTPGGVIGGLKQSEWDISFLGLSPERDSILSFTAPFLMVEHGYLVPNGSPISAIEQVDRPGVRIGTPQGGSVNATLARILKNARVIPGPSLAAAADMLSSGKVDAFAANKANLFEVSDKLPGSKVLSGRIGADEIAIAVPKGREAGMPYLQKFIQDANFEGLIKAAVQRAGLRGAVDK